MKRILLYIILLLNFVSAKAQVSHISFMGIPLDGTISMFEQKLFAKGLKADREHNRTCDPSEKNYTGKFSGKEAEICIYFDYKTKIVYRAEVFIEESTEQSAINLFTRFEKTINDKYSNWEKEEKTYENFPDNYWRKENFGEINMYLIKKYKYLDETRLFINYIDHVNKEKHMDSQIQDL